MKPLKIYIIDDNPFIREAIVHHLKGHDRLEVSAFDSAEICLMDTLVKPDLIVLDFFLDGIYERNMNADLALKIFKERFHDVHIILISAEQNLAVLQEHKDAALEILIKSDDMYTNIHTIILNKLRHHKAA